MDRNLLFKLGRVLSVAALWLGTFVSSFGQSYTYTQGGLTVDIQILNVCTGTVSNSGGAIRFHVVSTEAGADATLLVVGPVILFPGVVITPGSTYEFNASHVLPNGTYNWLLGDKTNTIGSGLDPATYPPLTVQTLPLLSVAKDIEVSNTSCAAANGQIQASIVGGSQAIGPTTYSYIWSSDNGMPNLAGTTNGTTPLNLATLLGVSGLRGGNYSIDVTDNNSFCTARASFTITDPSPTLFTVTTPSPLNICSGDNISITLNNSEAGVTYEILKNLSSLPTPITFTGTGTGPFVMTFPSTAFASGNTIRVKAANGFCTPLLMNGIVTLNINPLPTITNPALSDVCQGSLSTSFTFSGTTGSPTQYTLDFDATAQAAGLNDIVNAALGASPIAVPIPAGVPAGSYNAILTTNNVTTSCSSAAAAVTLNILANPVFTVTSNPQACVGTTSASLPYTVSAGAPNQYTIDFDVMAQGQGFTDVAYTALPASPISIVVPVSAAVGTYNATITVRNSASGCVGSSQPFTVTVNGIPGATLSSVPAVCQGTTTAILAYSGLTGGANQYSIDFDPAAFAAGFLDVTSTPLPASPINIAVPAAVAAGTYNATVRIINSTTTCTSAALPITITVNPSPTITVTNLNPQVCLGATSTSLAYTATTGSPTEYTLDFDAAANTAGFLDVVAQALPVTPINVAIPAAAPAGTYNATLTVRNGTTTCVAVGQAVTITVNPTPAIALTTPNPQICRGTLTVPMPYTGVAGGADQYSIDFNPAANAAGFVDVTNQTLPASPINITVAAATVAGTYNGILTVRNSTTGCVSATQAITVTINPTPTITLSAIPSICQGTTTAVLGYTATTGGPTQYAIDFNAAANTAGFLDVTATTLPATPITINVPAAAAPGSYTGTITVTNTTTTCPSAPQTITVIIRTVPTITLTNANPQVCLGATTAPLTYSATTGSPDQYSLDFDAAANTAGMLDVTNQTLTASPIQVAIPPAVVAGTYNATLTIRNSVTSCGSTSLPVTITINPTPGATLTAIPAICQGTTTAILAYSAAAGGANQYSIDFNAAANTAGLADVTATALPASPINIAVPAAIAAATYSGTVRIINSVTGCTSAALPISLTVNPTPTITVTNLNPQVCLGATTTTLAYTATTGSPTEYSLDFNAAANTAGFVDIVDQALPTSPISVAIPAAAPAGTYTATLTVRNGATTCVAVGQTVTITINPTPAVTLTTPNPQICFGTLTVPMPYTGLAGGANQYSIDFDAAANTAGLVDVSNQALPASPISITVPAATVAGIYNATLTVRNSTSGCVSSSQPITITINPTPTITLSAIPVICQGTTSVNLGYTATTGSPTQYAIDFSAAANTAGFVDVTATVLPATPIIITVPAGAAPGTYTATVTVTNTTTTCPSAPQTVTIVINGNPTIALTNVNPQVCIGATSATLAYSGTTGTPDQYSLDFDAAANTAGFADVTNQALPASPITIAIPGEAVAGTYNATLTITNTTTSCGSTALPVTVTINPVPAATFTPIPDICAGATTAALAYSGMVGGADQYIIDFDAAANTAGFADIPATALPAGSIAIAVPGAMTPGTYNATVQLVNSVTGCVSALTPVAITINPVPTIIYTNLNPSVCLGSTTVLLDYTTTTGSPVTYSIDFNAAANTAGFLDITNQALPATPITVAVPASAGAGTYIATITVGTGSASCPSVAQTLTITIDPTPSITLTEANPDICLGATSAALAYSAVGGGADQYALDFDAAANTAGFADVPATALPASSIPVAVPGAAVAGTYNATLTITNSATGCVSAAIPVTITISPLPTIATTPIAAVCTGVASVDLIYTVTGSPGTITIDFDATAEAQGFVDVNNAPLTASPFAITVPATALAGTYNATVTVTNGTTGCASASQNITVTLNPSPTATITGPASVCAGTATQLTVTFTGTAPWSFTYSDGTTTSPVISTPFNTFNIPIANPTATTTYTIVSVGDATACPGVAGSAHTLAINTPPLANLAVSATINPLCAGGSSDVTVTGSENGVSYQLRNDADDSNIGTPVLGTGGVIQLPTGTLSATTSFNVLATVTGCASVELTNKVTINVSGAINAGLSVSADTDPICSGSGTNITIGTSENGVLYQLRNEAGDVNIGAAVAGTGSAISIPTGNLTATTTFNVLASNGTCSIELTNKVTVTVGASPDDGLAVNVTLDPLCSGGTTEVNVLLSQVGVTYQLRNDAGDVNVGPAVVGTGNTISLSTGVLTATTTFNVLATAPGCTAVELTTLVTVNVSGTIDATLPLTAAASPVCEGTGTDIQLANSEAGVNYQLRDATNTPVGAVVVGTGGTILFPTGNLTTTTSFNLLASNGACSIVLTDIETVNVDPAPNPALVITPTLNPLCVGGTSAITIQASQNGVSYQLRNDADDSSIGSPVAGTGSNITLSTGVLNTTTSFNILATSGVCTPVEMSTIVTVTVSGSVNAGLTVGSSASTICSGSGSFIQVVASETGVNYQLVNLTTSTPVGSPVAGTGATLNMPTGNLTASTTFGVIASNGSCSILLTDNETITVNPSPDLTLAVNAAQVLICSNVSTVITIANSQVGIQYQLRNDAGDVNIGSPVAGTGSTISISTGALTTTTTFNVFAISGTCSAELTSRPTVTIRPVGDPACGGTGGTDCTNFSAIQPTIVTQPSCNDRDAGEVAFNITRADGTPTTFRILWTINGNTQTKFTSSTANFNDLSSGLYQYTVIDEGNGKVCGPVDFFLDLKTQVKILDKQVTSNVTCFGGTDGNAILKVDGTTTGEYWYRYVVGGVESTAQTFTPGAPLPGGLPADDNAFIIIKVDDNFNFTCPDTVMVRIRNTYPKIDFAVGATDVTTCNGTDGSINVTGIAGGDSGANALQVRLKKAVPFSTDPSGYIVVSDFADVAGGVKAYANLAQGNYIVDVRDHRDCVQSKPIAVQAPGQVPLAVVGITATDATCDNAGESGAVRVTISEAGNYQVAISTDPLNVPDDSKFISYASPTLPSVTFANLPAGAYYLYIKSSTTTCPTRTDAIMINGVTALADFEVLSNCSNVNLTINNIKGQQSQPFVIRVFGNDDKFFKIDSLVSSSIPLSSSVTFTYAPPQHTFLNSPATYRFVMVQTQVTGAGSCTLVSDTVVYQVRELLGITLGTVKPSFPNPKHTGSIEIANVTGGTRFVGPNNALYYEISLTTADDDIIVKDWEKLGLDPQNKFVHLYDYLPPGVYRVKVRDAGGCIRTLDVEIPLETSIYVPNIFTPNNDGINDEFEVLNLPLTGNHKLIITNRWGNEVFTSGDYREGRFWNADNVSDGIYYYRLKVEGGEVYNGWVEIVRGQKP